MTENQTQTPVSALPSLCELKGVTQDFPMPNDKSMRVLENIDLAVQPREVVALLGPSGCGKSTLLRIMSGLIQPTRGQVLSNGTPLSDINPGVSVVFQSFALFPWMTITENLQAALEPLGLQPGESEERIQKVIQLVGLSGFEDAYPRELSGGMKQRVGIARALSVNPEVLFLDEPFSQVDALTAESLRAEVLDIWADQAKNPSSILLVSHDIEEVVLMADRIVVLGSNPGRILKVVENKVPRPRDLRSPEFQKMVDQLYDIISGHEIPDEPEAPPGTLPHPEPLPDVAPSEMLGLMEYLDARGGKEDVFRISTDTEKEFGDELRVVKAAELLYFLDTPKRLVILTPEGSRFIKARAAERQVIWKEQLLKLRLFKQVNDMLAKHPRARLDQELVKEVIILNLPAENYEKTFDTFVNWSRFGNLFAYDESTQKVFYPRKRAYKPRPKPTGPDTPTEPATLEPPATSATAEPGKVEGQEQDAEKK